MAAIDARLVEQVTGLNIPQAHRERVFAGLPAVLEAAPVDAQRSADIRGEIEALIAARDFRVIGAGDDQAIWQRGWGEVALALPGTGAASLDALKPQYFHASAEIRLLGEYWSAAGQFEYWLGVAVRRVLMLHTFEAPRRIIELGCGTGINLVLAAELFPEAELIGADWAPASVAILQALSRSLGREVEGVLYNMLTGEGAANLTMDSDTDVLTVHALEQLGSAGPRAVDMILARRPRRVLHIEPVLDFYDRNNPFDDIASRYHLARGYLQDLVPALEAHAAARRLEILSRGRVRLGNLYHDAYSFISWRPL